MGKKAIAFWGLGGKKIKPDMRELFGKRLITILIKQEKEGKNKQTKVGWY